MAQNGFGRSVQHTIQLTADVCQEIFYHSNFISYQMSAFPRRLRSLSIKRLFEHNREQKRRPWPQLNQLTSSWWFFLHQPPAAAITLEIVKLWPFGETQQVSRMLCMQKKIFLRIDANKPTKFVCVAVCCTKHSHSSLVFRVLFFFGYIKLREVKKIKLCKWPACRWSFFFSKNLQK